MRTIVCVQCLNTFETKSKRKDKRMCPNCLKTNKIRQVMLAKKRLIPTTEIGVGSGRSSKNLIRPLTDRNYRKVKKDSCELCGSTNNLCVHHVDHNRTNNNLNNLITVCKQCHQEHHIKRDKLGRYTRQSKTV